MIIRKREIHLPIMGATKRYLIALVWDDSSITRKSFNSIKTINDRTPKLPILLSFIISNLFSGFFPPKIPSKESATPSKWSPPVISIQKTTTKRADRLGENKMRENLYKKPRQRPIKPPTRGKKITEVATSVRFSSFLYPRGRVVRNLIAYKILFIADFLTLPFGLVP